MDWSFLINNKQSLSVSTDSRDIPAGCIFFALKGETFNGNQFAAQAIAKGAALAIIDEPEFKADDEHYMLVDNCLVALQELAREWRRELGIPVIGITGTNGKTTTKELLAAVLKTKYNLLYTQGNLNNSIGVPLTVLKMTREHNLALIEMGASHPGDITELVNICEPNYGLITNVGKAHLLGFGSFEGVMNTKRELYDFLAKHDGQVFINSDNPHLINMWARACEETNEQLPMTRGELPAAILYHTGEMLQDTHLVGDYNSENVQAALCVGEYMGIGREQGEKAIRAYIPQNNRSQLLDTQHNTVIVDAYNANVTSMNAALSAFRGDTLILGDMRELGEYSASEHQALVDLIATKSFKHVYLVGTEFGKTTAPVEYQRFENVEALKEHLAKSPLIGCHILLKGSHGIHLEKLIENL
ncbi:MAG: UDP-N-acetylmuramoyl-tripeptide--D-alanyl-D-alanine ligase [Paludibacteraceae bacterium]|nr:UDP-N-acetylmuramoyl-tripeptide--D-alanyl-D-alanine ligase [Paludibacteraceae bacterium]